MSPSKPDCLQSVLTLTSTGLGVLDGSGQFIDANPALCALLARSRDQLLGTPWLTWVEGEDREVVQRALETLLPGHCGESSCAVRVAVQNGSARPCRIKLQRVRPSDLPVALILQVEPTDADLPLAAELQRTATRTQSIIDHMPAMIAFWDRDFRNVFANRAYVDYFGWKPEDLRGHHIQDLLGPELWARNKPFFDQALGGKPVIFQRTLRDPSGRDRHTVASYVPSWNNGEVEGVTVFVTDETELKQALAARLEAQRDLQAVLDAAVDFLIVATDGEGVIRSFNRGAELLLGYSADELVGKATPQAFHDAGEIAARGQELSAQIGAPVQGFEVFIQEAKQGRTERRDWTLIAKDGRRMPTSLVVSPIVGLDGNITGYLGVARDVSAEVQARTEALAAMRSAESANQAKTRFLANMSHEIRTPMNAVLGVAELLAESQLGPQEEEYVSLIRTAGQTLLQTINDILDISKIEAGKMEVELAPFSPLEVLNSVVGILSYKAQEKGLRLNTNFPAQLPGQVMGQVMGDGVRLRQVLLNLVSNAIKFTHVGEVSLSVSVAADPERGLPVWHFAVADTGIGMDGEQLQRVFQPFVQAFGSTSRNYGGTGLGLSICKSLVELMGGTLDVTSAVDQGSEFRFALELAPVVEAQVVQAPPQPVAPIRLDGLRVLVVDDAELNQFVARSVLRAAGATVVCASDGRKALEVLRATPHEVDVVLMDVLMPVMNGYDATQAIRQELGLSVPVLGLSAGVTQEQVERCRSAGMDGFVGKPFQKAQLLGAIREILAGARQAGG